MASTGADGAPNSRVHLYREFTQRFEGARSQKDGLARYASVLSGQITQGKRVLAERERERCAALFQQPRTPGSQSLLDMLEREIKSMGADIADLERNIGSVENAIRTAEEEMAAARKKLDDELAKLE